MAMIEYDRLINRMKAVSPGVTSYIDNKLYLPPSIQEDIENGIIKEDQITDISDEQIIAECYDIILIELRESGIIFHCDYDEVMGDFYNAENLIILRELFQLHEFINRIKDHDKLFDSLKDRVEEEEHFEELITHILDEMVHYYPLDEELNRLYEWCWDRLHNDFEFFVTIKDVISNMEKIITMTDEILSDSSKLIEYVQEIRSNIQPVLDKILTIPNLPIDPDKLNNRVEQMNMNMLSDSASLVDFTWWFKYKDNQEELDKEDKERWIDIGKQHRTNSDHHWEYYIQNDDPVGITEIILLLFGMIELDPMCNKTMQKNKLLEYLQIDKINYEEDTEYYIKWIEKIFEVI